MDKEELVKKSLEIKNKGNDEYLKKNFEKAEEFYTEAIKMIGERHLKAAAYYCNRSSCLLHLEKFGSALEDGKIATEIDE